VTRLTLVRHGQTDWNLQHRIQGSSDIPLNDTGRAQAAAARHGLWAELTPSVTVVSSHLGRAQETARILCEGRDVTIHTDERLAERAYGVWEGMLSDQRAMDFPEEFARWQSGREPRIEGYETHYELASRVQQAALDWADRVGDGGELLFVSHGSAGRMLLLELLGLPLTGLTLGHLENTAWSRVARSREGRWTLERHNAGAGAVPTGPAGPIY